MPTDDRSIVIKMFSGLCVHVLRTGSSTLLCKNRHIHYRRQCTAYPFARNLPGTFLVRNIKSFFLMSLHRRYRDMLYSCTYIMYVTM
jgi:hypothetical protein